MNAITSFDMVFFLSLVFVCGFATGWWASFVLIFRRPKLERMNEETRLQIEHARLQIEHEIIKRRLLVSQGRHEEVA